MNNSLILPLPPSANRIWRTTRAGVTYRAPQYRAWLDECVLRARVWWQGKPALEAFEVRIWLPPARIDPDNRVKPTLDLLQKASIVQNDRLLRYLELAVSVDPEKGYMHLWVMPARF